MESEVAYSARKTAYIKAVPSTAEGGFMVTDLRTYMETDELVLMGIQQQDILALENGDTTVMEKYVKVDDQDPTVIQFLGCTARAGVHQQLKGALFVNEVIEITDTDRVGASQ